MPKFVLLWTDASTWLLVAALAGYVAMVLRRPQLAKTWGRVFRDPAALASFIVLVLALAVALVDSIHYRPLLPPVPGVAHEARAYDTRTRSLLDVALARLIEARESSYSQPLAYRAFGKQSVVVDGEARRIAPRLQYGGRQLSDPEHQWAGDIARRIGIGLALGAAAAGAL
ncbi:MAG: ABC transporter permease, partial [Burkholderiales bacterium]|nr:ABC transporter permease [Burkholderiales bacterium]